MGDSEKVNELDVDADRLAGEFAAAYPEFAATAAVDRLREREYSYLDDNSVVYLDYTGSGLAALAQHRAHHQRLTQGVFGNPHSENPASRAATELVEKTRRRILTFLHADPEEYCVIFTPNASGACRLVAEAYPFGERERFVFTADNHSSIVGMREFARCRSAEVVSIPVDGAELRTSTESVSEVLATGSRRGLFAFPAQSNFTGVQHPWEWASLAQEYGYHVLCDVAGYLPTNAVDLSVVKPDFLPISWYKVFGYPTGVGCLVARRETLTRLQRPWFAGGTIMAMSATGDWHRMAPDESRFEDGTLNFLAIPDVADGLSWISGIGVEVIHRRVRCLAGWLLQRLTALRHTNGAPLVRVYGPQTTEARGGTIACNLLDPTGSLLDERLVQQESADAGFCLRTGCFCNSGAGEGAFALPAEVLRRLRAAQHDTFQDFLNAVGMPTGGAVRVSLGVASTVEDVEKFVAFVTDTYRDRPATHPALPPRLRC